MEIPDEIDTKTLLKYSPAYFINKVYGYKVNGCHQQILDHLIDEKFSLTLVARGHGKSRILGGYLTWLVCNNPNLRTILVSDTYTKSVLFLRAIKQTIESSPVIREFYGDLKGETWSDSAIIIKGRDQIFVEPSILAVGAGSGQIVGMHADKIFVDDLVSFDSSRSELQRERDKSWFKTNLLPVLMSSGSIGIVGTRYHQQDFYQMVMDDLKYKPLILPAINKSDKSLCEWLQPLEDKFNEDGELIQLGLKSIREQLGQYIFELQYQNSIDLTNEDAIIKYDYIQYYDKNKWLDNKLYVVNNGKDIKINKIILAVDPAISEKETADYSGMCIGGKDRDGNIYILDTSNKHLSFNKLKKEIYRLNTKWSPNQVVIENVGFQLALIQELKKESGLNIVDIKPTRDKTARLMQTSGFFESKRVHFLKDQREIVNQLLEFPNGRNDDLVDSVVYVLNQMRSGGSGMLVLRM